MPKKRVTFKIPLIKRRKMQGGADEEKKTCIVHAAWCGHCKAIMEPKEDGKSIWEEAKEKIGSKCIVEEYEETKDETKIADLKNEYADLSIDGFPTIFKINNGKIEYFKDKPTADGIYNFAIGEQASSNEDMLSIQNGGKRKSKRKTTRRKKSIKSGWFW